MDYKTSSNFIFGSLLTGVYDVNRNELLPQNDFSIIQKWYDSILKLKLKAIIFHNTFSKDIVEKYSNEYIQFVNVEYTGELNPNVFRYFVYRDYLQQNVQGIHNLFITDITDVEVVSNPFTSSVYLQNADCLFCGDEPEMLDNAWMHNHNTHLRNLIPGFSDYEALNKHKTLLNCGVIGAAAAVMLVLLNRIVDIHKACSFSNKTPYTLDMGVFNYIAQTQFAEKIIHGNPVTTVFKKYETERTDCWFRHK